MLPTGLDRAYLVALCTRCGQERSPWDISTFQCSEGWCHACWFNNYDEWLGMRSDGLVTPDDL